MTASTIHPMHNPRVCHWLLLFAAAGFAAPASAAIYTVINTTDGGPGSLRDAITSANTTMGADTVAFDLPGPGAQTIAPASPLPTLTDAGTTIDGYTQPSAIANTLAAGDDAVIMVRIDGGNAGIASSGLTVCADATLVRGLSITGFAGFGVGIGLDSANLPCGAQPLAVALEGNFIGLAPDGVNAAGNETAVGVTDADNVSIGGGTPDARNLIAASGSAGISIFGASVDGMTIDGNYIGTERSGTLDHGNTAAGILAGIAVTGLVIGGVAPNRIAFNDVGIHMTGASKATFFANEIHSNDSVGIDLELAGDPPGRVTPNDVDDADLGANDGQNFPVLTLARRGVTTVEIAGTLDRPAGPAPLAYTIAVYASAACDASGHGEGERLLGAQTLALLSGSAESFAFTLNATPPLLGSQITATATDAAGNTSEFSACVPLQEHATPFVVSTTADAGPGSLRQAIADANADVNPSVVTFAIAGAGPHTIALLSALPTITTPVLVDAYTQPGAVPNALADGDDAVIKIHLDDGAAVSRPIRICGADVTVRGLSLTRFGFPVSIGTATEDGLTPCTAMPSDIAIEGNFIGLGPDGSTLSGNTGGVFTTKGSNVRIGGEAPAQRNVIAGNGSNGVSFRSSESTGGVVCNNYIGTDRSGILDRGNAASGVAVADSVAGVRIGCAAPNRIAFNARGVDVFGSASGADLSGNDIFANDGLGIDLIASGGAPDGVTANDANDVDGGGNALQNFPVLTRAEIGSGPFVVEGTLDVPAPTIDQIYRIDVYENIACDSSGNGEGAIFLGATRVRLSNAGESFYLEVQNQPEFGGFVTATATAPNGNTSEFSACRAVLDGPPLLSDGFE